MAENLKDGKGITPHRPGVVCTNLYPTRADPMRGSFNRQQFSHLGRLHELLILVPTAKRWPCRPRARREAPRDPHRDGPEVTNYRVWHPPLVGRWSNARILYLTTRIFLAGELRAKQPHYILGSFAYPDGVAAALLARWLGVPAFIKVHGSDINLMADGGPRGRQIRWALRRVDGVIAVSRALVDRVTSLGADPRNTLLLYNAVDRELFRPKNRSVCRRRLHLPDGRHSLLYVGNLKREKGVMDLAEAFFQMAAEDRDLDLEIVGTGPLERELEARVTAKGLGRRIHLHGSRPHEEIAEWLGACDVLCLPSHAEGVPNVVLEALASGRPVVSTRVGGVAEVLSERAGKLVEPGEPQALASAIRQVLSAEWPAEELSRTLVASDWPENARLLSQFIETRCNRIRTGS